MIVSTIFSGLVIAKLLKKDVPKLINNLNDLRALPDLKIIVVPNSYIDDVLEVSPNLDDIKERIEYQRYSCNKITTTLIQISRLFYFGLFSKTNHQMMI